MMEEQYLQIANDSPNILCSQVPAKVLEAAIADATEPSESYADFLQTGHTQWLLQKYGRLPRGKAEIRNAVVVLWMRACGCIQTTCSVAIPIRTGTSLSSPTKVSMNSIKRTGYPAAPTGGTVITGFLFSR